MAKRVETNGGLNGNIIVFSVAPKLANGLRHAGIHLSKSLCENDCKPLELRHYFQHCGPIVFTTGRI